MKINQINTLKPLGVKQRKKRQMQRIKDQLREEALKERIKNKEKFTYKKTRSTKVSPKK